MTDLETLCKNSKKASESLLSVSEKTVNAVLERAGKLLVEKQDYLIEENKKDIEKAKENKKTDAFIDRLTLNPKVIGGMAEGLFKLTELKSPVFETIYKYKNKRQGIDIKKVNVPFGVIGIIFESRPNVSADAFALCFKTLNAVILKGGSDAINSNRAIVNVIKQALKENGVSEDAISLIEDTSHETTAKFMKMNNYVDLLVPRGSAKLIKATVENATVPIIETGAGNCHVYVDESADIEKAVKVIFNAKTQRYSVCNACESLVFHAKALNILPAVYEKLQEKKVEMRLDERSMEVLKGKENVLPATDEDFYAEYGDAIISVKTVDSVEEAIAHINSHSTHHSESIITEDKLSAEKFLTGIDSSTVYYNASTRFSDGYEFGLGAELGISTQKLHARGPMGLSALVTTKYIVKGNGAVRK